MNENARALGRLARGKVKRLSAQERDRRREHGRAVLKAWHRKKKEQMNSTVVPGSCKESSGEV